MASEGSVRTAVLLNDTSGHKHHGCSLVVRSILDAAAREAIQVNASAPLHADWRRMPAIVTAMEKADLIIVNGEGTIHHDAPRGEALLLAARFAKDRHKRAVLLNTTWEANSPRLAALASLFDIVSVRETASARALISAGVPCRVTPDLALGAIPQRLSRHDRHGVAFSDNVVTASTLAQYAAMESLGGEPLGLLHGRLGLKYSVGSVRRYLRAGGDLRSAFNAMLYDRRSQYPNFDDMLERLMSRRLVVTGRFHMMIMCLATATPFLAIRSNTHKIESVMEDVGLSSWRLPDIAHLDQAIVERASRWEPGEIEKIDAYLAAAARDRRALFRDVRLLTEA